MAALREAAPATAVISTGLPILSSADHGNGAANAMGCSNGIDAEN